MKKLVLSVILSLSLANASTIGIGKISNDEGGTIVKLVHEFSLFDNYSYIDAEISNANFQKYSINTHISKINNFSLFGGIGFEKFAFEEKNLIKIVSNDPEAPITYKTNYVLQKEKQLFLKYTAFFKESTQFTPFGEINVGTKSINLNAGTLIYFSDKINSEVRIWKRYIYNTNSSSKWDELKGVITVNYSF